MDYVGRFEVQLGGEFDEDATALLNALEATGLEVVMAGDEARKQVLVTTQLEASDGMDAVDQLRELLEAVWERAFAGRAPSPVLVLTATAGIAPRPEGSDVQPARSQAEREAAEEAELYGDVDAELEAEEAGAGA